MKKGDRVMIYNRNYDGSKVIKEGMAKLVKKNGSIDDWWLVEFDGEPGVTYPRFASKDLERLALEEISKS